MTAPNPCGTMNGLYTLISRMLDKIYNDGDRVLGNIVYEARCEVIQQYFPNQSMYGPAVLYVTLGDPALRLKYPFSPGKVENGHIPVQGDVFRTSIINGPLILPVGKDCRIFDITGRDIIPTTIKPGIYFIEVDGEILQKVIKIR